MVIVRESWWSYQPNYNPDPEPGLGVDTYTFCELLEHMKGMKLQMQNIRIPTTQDSRISKRSTSESPLLMVERKPEASNQTNDSWQ